MLVHHDRRKRGKRVLRQAAGAFTLVEAAVVTSVVLFALALLAPALRQARARDKLVECLANLQTIGQAGRIYAAEDPGELFIPVPVGEVVWGADSGAIDWGGKAGRGQPVNMGNPTSSPFGTDAYRGPAHRPLNFYLYKGGFVDYNPVDGTPNPGPGNINWLRDTQLDLDIYRCPADTGYAGGGFLYTATSTSRPDRNETAFMQEGLTAYDHYGTSYNAIILWVVGGLAGMQFSSQGIYLTPLSRVPSPAHTLAYEEIPAWFVWLWGNWDYSGCDYSNRVTGNFNTVPGWHGDPFHFNATFGDGHAATIEKQGSFRPPPNLGLPNYPTGVCAEGVDPYECERCITFRGPGWQMDTLPAEAVPTPYYGEKSSVALPAEGVAP